MLIFGFGVECIARLGSDFILGAFVVGELVGGDVVGALGGLLAWIVGKVP